MASALVVAVAPNSWFQLDAAAAIDHWGRSIWPKLNHDAKALDLMMPGRGARYSIFVLYCASLLILISGITLPVTWWAISKSSERLTYPQSSAAWKIPLAVLLFVFWNVFETTFLISDTSVSRAITSSAVLWFWIALTWGALGMTLGGAGIFIAKLWTHGLPENSDEYRQRILRS